MRDYSFLEGFVGKQRVRRPAAETHAVVKETLLAIS
jgi:hypothetical protein